MATFKQSRLLFTASGKKNSYNLVNPDVEVESRKISLLCIQLTSYLCAEPSLAFYMFALFDWGFTSPSATLIYQDEGLPHDPGPLLEQLTLGKPQFTCLDLFFSHDYLDIKRVPTSTVLFLVNIIRFAFPTTSGTLAN